MHMGSVKLVVLKHVCSDCFQLTALMLDGLISAGAQWQQDHINVSGL